MKDIHITEQGVLKLLRNEKPHKATGPDDIPAFILKTAANQLASILTEIYQYSLETGQVPQDWRDALVVPILKKGEIHIPANYRPVSLTSISCKILEHIIHSSIMKHFDIIQPRLNKCPTWFQKQTFMRDPTHCYGARDNQTSSKRNPSGHNLTGLRLRHLTRSPTTDCYTNTPTTE